jgi:hypothetical protein
MTTSIARRTMLGGAAAAVLTAAGATAVAIADSKASSEVADIHRLRDRWNALREHSLELDDQFCTVEAAWRKAVAAARPAEPVTSSWREFDRWEAEKVRLRTATGVDAVEQARKRHWAEVDAAFQAMISAPATTVAALQAKGALIEEWEDEAEEHFLDPGDDRNVDFVRAILRDLGQLGERAAGCTARRRRA